jgi:hypothetical protein
VVRERVRRAAKKTTGETLEANGYVAERAKGRQIIDPDNQLHRATGNGVGVVTQRRLDRLAREFPKLHKQVCDGELSVHRASINAGIVKVPTPFEAAMKAVKKLNAADRRKLIRWQQTEGPLKVRNAYLCQRGPMIDELLRLLADRQKF